MRRLLTLVFLSSAILCALLYTRTLSAADPGFPIYFQNSTLTVKPRSFERTTYLPLIEVLQHMGLAYTDATGLQTFTIQERNSTLVLRPGSSSISLNGQSLAMENPARREGGQWFVPTEFLTMGLARVAGLEFRRPPSGLRAFAGVAPAELTMSGQTQGQTTRLTLRMDAAFQVELQRDVAARRVVLILTGKPVEPLRERLDYKDRLVQSVVFDDADGTPKILVEMSEEVRDIRLSSSEESRVHFIDFVPEMPAEPVASPVAPAPLPPVTAVPNATPANLGVIAIDAGHGGIETGATNSGTLEKDLTLALARSLRAALQSRVGSAVVLTRDTDVALTSEARSEIANNSHANLFVSLHIGYSPDKGDAGSSIFLMKPDFTGGMPAEPPGGRLFLPWYMAYRIGQPSSEALAMHFQNDLSQALPGWKFPLRTGPVSVLASLPMPAVLIEAGNLNNDVSAQTLTDPAFQARFASAMADAIVRFAESQPTGRER